MQFRILGPVEIEIDGEVRSLPSRRERCLLGVLLLEANRVVSVDRLADLLWEGEPPKRVRGAVQGNVSRLRAVLAKAAGANGIELVYAGDGYRMVVDPEAVDAHRFRRMLDRAAQVTDLAERVDQLRSALDLWRGPALVDAVGGPVRERICSGLEEQRLAAIEDFASASLALRRERDVLPELARIAGDHPGRERLVGLHMRALYQAGRRVEALDVYTRARAFLSGELGLDPGPELRELHQSILREELPVPAKPAATGTPAPSPIRKVIPRQLPADPTGFAGRVTHLEQLDSVLPSKADGAMSVVISAIGGTAGVGKTALAVHWAHRVSGEFPDGQLYLNLRGFDPSGYPMDRVEALRVLLDGLQVPPQRIPASLDAQVGLYRSLLADRRMLVVLDNARDAEQVRLLLPGTSGCLALVTSRNELSGLVATEGAQTVALDVLTRSEAHRLLARRLGANRILLEPEATEEIITRCAGLPLALVVVAARAATRPGASLRSLATELAEASNESDPLANPDAMTDVRNVFSWSYHALEPAAARLFRLLGLHPGPDVTDVAAASLTFTSVTETRHLLAELARTNLVTEHASGRFTFHDLLRTYASELVQRDSDEDRRAALTRMYDHYLHSARSAQRLRDPHRKGRPSQPPQPGAIVVEPRSNEEADAWFGTEYRVLLKVVEQAAADGAHAYACRIARHLNSFLNRHGYWQQQLASQRIALLAARQLGDRSEQACAHTGIGDAYAALGDYSHARDHHEQAIDLFGLVGDQESQAYSNLNITWLELQRREYREAIVHAERSLELFRTIEDRAGEGRALNMVGWLCGLLGEYRRGVTHCEEALAIEQEVGDGFGEALTWDSLGYLHHNLGDHRRAIACFENTLALYDHHEHRQGRADTLHQLGDAYLAMGDRTGARNSWLQCLEIYDELEIAYADEVRRKLSELAS